MALTQQQQDLQLFFEYQGINENNANRQYYVQQFTNFQFYRMSCPGISFERAYIKWMQLPCYPTTMPMLTQNQNRISTQTTVMNDAPLQPDLTLNVTQPPIYDNAKYYNLLDLIKPNNEAEYLLTEQVLDEGPENVETSSSSDENEQPPQIVNTPPPPPTPPYTPIPNPHSDVLSPKGSPLFDTPEVEKNALVEHNRIQPMGKDIDNLKRTYKRKAEKQKSGRPNKHVHLARIANDDSDEIKISSQDLILLSLAGGEKKRKTILTTCHETIETYNLKHYNSYLHMGEEREQALLAIKAEKEKLENLYHIEKLMSEALKERKNKKVERQIL